MHINDTHTCKDIYCTIIIYYTPRPRPDGRKKVGAFETIFVRIACPSVSTCVSPSHSLSLPIYIYKYIIFIISYTCFFQ